MDMCAGVFFQFTSSFKRTTTRMSNTVSNTSGETVNNTRAWEDSLTLLPSWYYQECIAVFTSSSIQIWSLRFAEQRGGTAAPSVGWFSNSHTNRRNLSEIFVFSLNMHI